MEALQDHTVGVYCWLDQGSGRIISLRGKNLRLLTENKPHGLKAILIKEYEGAVRQIVKVF